MIDVDKETEKEQQMFETNEQWKGYGICEKCRRVSYCNKDCSARKAHIASLVLARAAKRFMSKKSGGK